MEHSIYKILLDNQDLTGKEIIEKLNLNPKTFNPQEIRERYDYMLSKVIEILKNGNTVKLVDTIDVPGNHKLMFHFYSPKQVINDLRKYFDMGNFIVSRDYQIVNATELHEYSMEPRWKDVWIRWKDYSIPPRIIESYVFERFTVKGGIISYLNNEMCL